MKLTENFTLEEMIASSQAKKHDIKNIPDAKSIANLKLLAEKCLQPIRNYYKKPVTINSGYRCYGLNRLVGGAANSQHLEGKAVDFVIKGVSIQAIINWARLFLPEFDQLINEKNKWVHISFNKGKNRKEVLSYDGKHYIKI